MSRGKQISYYTVAFTFKIFGMIFYEKRFYIFLDSNKIRIFLPSPYFINPKMPSVISIPKPGADPKAISFLIPFL